MNLWEYVQEEYSAHIPCQARAFAELYSTCTLAQSVLSQLAQAVRARYSETSGSCKLDENSDAP